MEGKLVLKLPCGKMSSTHLYFINFYREGRHIPEHTLHQLLVLTLIPALKRQRQKNHRDSLATQSS